MNTQTFFPRKAIGVVAIILVVVAVSYFASSGRDSDIDRKPAQVFGYKDAEYLIEGQRVKLYDGYGEMESASSTMSKTITRYFGNELRTDLNGDGREDIAFILTQERGGSGTFFYAVAAVATENGYAGSDGYFLGDRISPQSTNISPNPVHKNVVVFNYADRAIGEAMTEETSVGKSAYLKLDPESMQWGIVVPDFEGESR